MIRFVGFTIVIVGVATGLSIGNVVLAVVCGGFGAIVYALGGRKGDNDGR